MLLLADVTQALLGAFSGGEFHKHRDALTKVVALRGGYDAIKTESLRITLSWYVN